ncbi:MAG: response regulator [Elusimicrobia bacterium]|nr:response regulator [Elusimicrobiota bacterium]
MAKRLLIVDDNEEIVSLVRTLFVEKGWQVDAAVTGEAAMGQAMSATPDVVILDRNLPDGDGAEFCRRIKCDPDLFNVPVLMISGLLTDPEEQAQGLAAGAAGYLVKPFALADLASKVEALAHA